LAKSSSTSWANMITVHMTTFRRLQSGLLARAVESVLAQTYKDLEFIICDDASTDGTHEYLQSVAAADSRVKVIRNPKNVNSVAISLGRCLKQADATQPYVTWMFDDCTIERDAFEILMQQISDDGTDFVFGTTRVHNPDGSILLVGNQSASTIRSQVMSSSILVPNGGILFKRLIFDEIGWYDANIILRRSCDWDLFKRIIHAHYSFSIVDKVMMEEYGGLQSDSLRNVFTTTFEIMAKYARLRDGTGMNLSLDACLSAPVDFIPAGDWSNEELALIFSMFVEYYLSIGNVARAYVWAEKLKAKLPNPPFYFDNLAACVNSRDTTQSLMAAGAITAGVYYAYRDQQLRRS
jgi:glycosyltransferase involved in cell wall biosynthesis